VLAAEDDEFFSHSGVSYTGLIRSVFRLLVSGEVQGGGSTITMQVAGNYLTGRDVNLFRKIKDIFLAYRLEKIYSKEEIFEFYVNRIFLGNRAYGIASASEVYYGTTIKDLNLAQWAMIAGLPKAPSSMNPLVNPRRALIRRNWILTRMLDLGSIHPEQYDLAIKAPISATYHGLVSEVEASYYLAIKAPISATYHGLVSEVEASYFSEIIRRYMISEYGLDAYKEGLEVYTTIDSKLQNLAVSALKEGLEKYDKRHGFRSPENYKDLFPEDFFSQDISYRLSLIAESKSLPVGISEVPEEEPLDNIYNLLNNLTTTDNKFPVLVLSVEDNLVVISGDRTVVQCLIAESKSLPVGISEVPEEEPLDNIYNLLNNLTTTDNKFPVLVLSVEDNLVVISGDRTVVQLAWTSNLGWARPYINEDQRGPRPKSYSELLQEGDLVWLEQDKIKSSLSLTQIPEVQGSIVAMDPNNGEVKALVGGYDFFLSKYNRATQSSPLLGSNYKPFLYASALDAGLTASSLINDAPIVFEDEALEDKWRPRNASGRFYGPTRLREALLQSVNLVSIRLLREIGIERVRDYSQNFGFQLEELNSDLSLALGTASLSPIKNVAAYSVFANGGKSVEPYFISKITDRTGNTIFQKEDIEINQAIDPRIAFIIKDILQEAASRGTAKKVKELGRGDLAGKTGTTNEAESTWFTGFNESLVTTVWVGFDQPKSLGNREFGSSTALPIWMDFMQPNIDNLPKNKNLPPKGIVSIKIDKKTGLKAESDSRNSIFEYYLEEHLPR